MTLKIRRKEVILFLKLETVLKSVSKGKNINFEKTNLTHEKDNQKKK